jgi:hypothetical protein
MSRIHGIRSRRISLVERSRSSLCCCCFNMHVNVRMFLLLLVTPMRVVSGRSRPMRARFPIETCRRKSLDGAHPLLGRMVCALRER